jgi:hypothetical protein
MINVFRNEKNFHVLKIKIELNECIINKIIEILIELISCIIEKYIEEKA